MKAEAHAGQRVRVGLRQNVVIVQYADADGERVRREVHRDVGAAEVVIGRQALELGVQDLLLQSEGCPCNESNDSEEADAASQAVLNVL